MNGTLLFTDHVAMANMPSNGTAATNPPPQRLVWYSGSLPGGYNLPTGTFPLYYSPNIPYPSYCDIVDTITG